MLLHAFSVFHCPSWAIRRLEQIRRSFFWSNISGGRGMCLISWDSICQSKESGGLGLRDLKVVNRALLGKWFGRISGAPGMWRSCLGERRAALIWRGVKRGAGWSPIASFLVANAGWLGDLCRIQIRDGRMARLWFDVRVEGTPLRVLLGGLFARARFQEITVREAHERFIRSGLALFFRTRGRPSTTLRGERAILSRLLGDMVGVLEEGSDEVGWHLWRGHSRPAQGILRLLSDGGVRWGLADLVWSRRGPARVRLFLWKMLKGALPTAAVLHRRGGLLDSRCLGCLREVEDLDHLFAGCPQSREVWRVIGRRVGIVWLPEGARDLWEKWKPQMALAGSGVWGDFLLCVCWAIWLARNKKIFEGVSSSTMSILSSVTFFWRTWAGRDGIGVVGGDDSLEGTIAALRGVIR